MRPRKKSPTNMAWASASPEREFQTAARPSASPRTSPTARASARLLDQVALAYGGFDSICVTAGIFVSPDTTGHIPDDKWALTFNINVTGSYLVGDEAFKTWKEQGLKGQLVLTTSANAVVAKKGSRGLRRFQGGGATISCANWPSNSRRSCA